MTHHRTNAQDQYYTEADQLVDPHYSSRFTTPSQREQQYFAHPHNNGHNHTNSHSYQNQTGERGSHQPFTINEIDEVYSNPRFQNSA
mmetsp:Transcript_29699/g.27168  ORF Transcript_29699/g.27168 Transcript_29699/m.27168 type:complete len:87 (+) Transcript_29699:117-377(+)